MASNRHLAIKTKTLYYNAPVYFSIYRAHHPSNISRYARLSQKKIYSKLATQMRPSKIHLIHAVIYHPFCFGVLSFTTLESFCPSTRSDASYSKTRKKVK